MGLTSKELHDSLLASKPDGASHDPLSCPHCTEVASEQEEEEVADEQKIFTQEQHEQLLASAVEKATVEATASADGEVLRLNERLEAAEKELADRDAKIEEFTSTIAEREEQDRLEALAEERVKLVQAAANFSDEQIQERRVHWAKMDEETFTGYLTDIKVASAAPKETVELPETEFEGTRETAGKEGTEGSVIKQFFNSTVLETARQL